MTGIENKYHELLSEKSDRGKTINVIPHRELVSLNENQNKHGADITQAQETPVFELYKNRSVII